MRHVRALARTARGHRPAWTSRSFTTFPILAQQAQPARASTTTTRSQTLDFSALPASKVDITGLSKPLAQWSEAGETTTEDTERNNEVDRAVARGIIPSTPLAKEIYKSWKRFPGCTVLTRVGKFYEIYFHPAIRLSSLLSLKLVYKEFRSSRAKSGKTVKFPFTGFPHTMLDKYLKILVNDLGETVVIMEQDDATALKNRQSGTETALHPRKVGRVVTPGTLVDESWLSREESRYLLALALDEGKVSLAYTDVSTGEFFCKDTEVGAMEDELARIAPREVVLDEGLRAAWQSQGEGANELVGDLLTLLRVLGVHVSFADPSSLPDVEHMPSHMRADENLESSDDGVASEEELSDSPTLEATAIALLRHHLLFALRDSMPALPTSPHRHRTPQHMLIDAATLQALEIRHAIRPGGLSAVEPTSTSRSPLSSRGTLLSVLNQTSTISGHRLLLRTLTSPSTSLPVINARLALVQTFVDREDLRFELGEMLRRQGDIMRVIQRLRGNGGDARDLWEVGVWIREVDAVLDRICEELEEEERRGLMESEGHLRLEQVLQEFRSLSELAEKIESAIDEEELFRGLDGSEENIENDAEDAGDALLDSGDSQSGAEEDAVGRRGGTRAKTGSVDADEREDKERQRRYIRPTFSSKLQGFHNALVELEQERFKMQDRLRKTHKAGGLVLKHDVKLGYFVWASKSDATKLKASKTFQLLSELKSRSAFVYNPWTALATQMRMMSEQLDVEQHNAFVELRLLLIDKSEDIQNNAERMDELDLAMSFAKTAVDMRYVRPILNDSTDLTIVAGRHPSVETSLLAASRLFTPNSTRMDAASHMHIITGPNQGGKSTLLRQTAVIAILAQCGSFVPADHAEMGVVDKVFSRVGARDDLWRDRSTFMLEMAETANILKNATERSLVIMDEIGRGTTLQAGLSIAYATIDHLLSTTKCRTLFATHLHELGGLLGAPDSEDQRGIVDTSTAVPGGIRDGVEFWCTDVDELDGAFAYSYKLRPGINHNSHAIKTAKMAGMPDSFLETAQHTLEKLQAASSDAASQTTQ